MVEPRPHDGDEPLPYETNAELDARAWRKTSHRHAGRAFPRPRQEAGETPVPELPQRREGFETPLYDIGRERRAHGGRQSPEDRFQRRIEQYRAQRTELITPTGEVEEPTLSDAGEDRYGELTRFRIENFRKAQHEFRQAERRIRELREELAVQAAAGRGGAGWRATEAEQTKAINDIFEEIEREEAIINGLWTESPESAYFMGRHELSRYIREGRQGRIVETPSVRRGINRVERSLRTGAPVFLYGETGTGKTQVAKHIARTRFGREAITVRGFSKISNEHLFGHNKLSAEGAIAPKDVPDELARLMEVYRAEHPHADDEDLAEVREQISQALVRRTGTLESGFGLGPVYQAMHEGRILIIDETNYIPPDLLASLNELMNLRPGEIVDVQEDGLEPFRVAEGFGIIFTGNINLGEAERYRDRFKLDTALRDRLDLQEWGMMPQEFRGQRETEAGRGNELFAKLYSSLLDQHETVYGPTNLPDKVWSLAQAISALQRLASEQLDDPAYYFNQKSGSTRLGLRDFSVSIRTGEKILTAWKNDGFREDLDGYVYREIVDQATDPTTRAYLYQLLTTKFDFFTPDRGWPDPHKGINYGDGPHVPYLRVDDPHATTEAFQLFTPLANVEVMYGPLPERTAWPAEKSAAEQKEGTEQAHMEKAIELQAELDTLYAENKKEFDELIQFCPLPEQAPAEVPAST